MPIPAIYNSRSFASRKGPKDEESSLDDSLRNNTPKMSRKEYIDKLRENLDEEGNEKKIDFREDLDIIAWGPPHGAANPAWSNLWSNLAEKPKVDPETGKTEKPKIDPETGEPEKPKHLPGSILEKTVGVGVSYPLPDPELPFVRMPRSVQAVYLRPLRRQAQYGVPCCDLQMRSYNVRSLEFFADFALRAAYYLHLPAYGPVPLPRITQRWTVPKSNFIFKKSQENFERVTVRRLIQIKDGHPETVELWLAFLRKHQYHGVGMKANVWEYEKLGRFLLVWLLLIGWKC